MLNVLAENHRNKQEKINLFEIGNIFISSPRDMSESNHSIVQHKMLSLSAVAYVITSNGV